MCVLKHCTDVSRGVVLKAWECGSNLSTLSSHVARVAVRGTVICGRRHTTHDDSWTVWCSLCEKWSKVCIHLQYFCSLHDLLHIDSFVMVLLFVYYAPDLAVMPVVFCRSKFLKVLPCSWKFCQETIHFSVRGCYSCWSFRPVNCVIWFVQWLQCAV